MQSTEIVKGNAAQGKVWVRETELKIGESQKVRKHLTKGFSWGNCGPGASQLALAVMLQFLPPEEAVLVYQDFKHAFVHKWEGDFSVASMEIAEWVAKKKSGIDAVKEIMKKRGKPVPKPKEKATEPPAAEELEQAA